MDKGSETLYLKYLEINGFKSFPESCGAVIRKGAYGGCWAERQRKEQYQRRGAVGAGEQSVQDAARRQNGGRDFQRNSGCAGLWGYARDIDADHRTTTGPGSDLSTADDSGHFPCAITAAGKANTGSTVLAAVRLRDVHELFMDTGVGPGRVFDDRAG